MQPLDPLWASPLWGLRTESWTRGLEPRTCEIRDCGEDRIRMPSRQAPPDAQGRNYFSMHVVSLTFVMLGDRKKLGPARCRVLVRGSCRSGKRRIWNKLGGRRRWDIVAGSWECQASASFQAQT